MQQVALSTCNQVLSSPIGSLNQMELALRHQIHQTYGDDVEKFALYAKLAVELDENGLGAQLVKI